MCICGKRFREKNIINVISDVTGLEEACRHTVQNVECHRTQAPACFVFFGELRVGLRACCQCTFFKCLLGQISYREGRTYFFMFLS